MNTQETEQILEQLRKARRQHASFGVGTYREEGETNLKRQLEYLLSQGLVQVERHADDGSDWWRAVLS